MSPWLLVSITPKTSHASTQDIRSEKPQRKPQKSRPCLPQSQIQTDGGHGKVKQKQSSNVKSIKSQVTRHVLNHENQRQEKPTIQGFGPMIGWSLEAERNDVGEGNICTDLSISNP